MSERLELGVGADEDGLRLDALVAMREEVASRAAAQRLIDAGAVTVDGEVRAKAHRVARGERIVVALEEAEEAAPAVDDVPFEVAFEDEHLMVVDKPAGVVVHPASGHHGGTLAQTLAGRAAGGPDPERPGIVHRLDRDTSGLLVVAKSEQAFAELGRMIRAREAQRRYIALVVGAPDADSGTIDAAIGRDRSRRTLVSTRTDQPRRAVTRFTVLERLPRTTLLEVELETGRTHQIRAHLEAIGHPVCGDPQYGGAPCGARLGLTRQFLHAAKLVFRHPMTGNLISCESKPPADLSRTLDKARRDPVSGGPDGG